MPIWLIAAGALRMIAPRSGLPPWLAGDEVRVILGARGMRSLSPGWDVSPVVVYRSAWALTRALAASAIPPEVSAVLYDPEIWPFTPEHEQNHPVRSTALAARECHRRGLELIAAPAAHLALRLQTGPGSKYDNYLASRLAAATAEVADALVIQAQQAEVDVGLYRRLVHRAAAQARSANPLVRVLAGLSTNPSGSPPGAVDPRTLVQAAQAVMEVVDGFSLNIPSPGPLCPVCPPARPDVAIDFLRALQALLRPGEDHPGRPLSRVSG